ncbi:MAG: hypothetical protein ACI9BW_004535 [Gammaproteobacteria bacterium]|jgi:hypothetical protein
MSIDSIATLKKECAELTQKLASERDEINVQMHLAKAEAREEWERTEQKWHHFQNRAATAGDAAADASKEVGAAMRLLAHELKAGYQRIRESVKQD